MSRRQVIIDFGRCRPELCPDGICAATLACPRKLLKQEQVYESPLPSPVACPTCADCQRACPFGAIDLR